MLELKLEGLEPDNEKEAEKLRRNPKSRLLMNRQFNSLLKQMFRISQPGTFIIFHQLAN